MKVRIEKIFYGVELVEFVGSLVFRKSIFLIKYDILRIALVKGVNRFECISYKV